MFFHGTRINRNVKSLFQLNNELENHHETVILRIYYSALNSFLRIREKKFAGNQKKKSYRIGVHGCLARKAVATLCAVPSAALEPRRPSRHTPGIGTGLCVAHLVLDAAARTLSIGLLNHKIIPKSLQLMKSH